jgi:hypothetical protein
VERQERKGTLFANLSAEVIAAAFTHPECELLSPLAKPRAKRLIENPKPPLTFLLESSEIAMTPTDAELLRGKYPAKAHAAKVAEHIIKKGGDATGTLYIEGHRTKMHEVGDHLTVERGVLLRMVRRNM